MMISLLAHPASNGKSSWWDNSLASTRVAQIANHTVFTRLRGTPYFGLAQLLYLKQLAFLALVNVTTYFDIPNIA